MLGLRSSLRKQLNYAQILGKRDSRLEEPPPLWLLSAGRPETLFERFHFRPTPGVEEGRTLGRNEGRESALREAIAVLCEVLGIPLSEERQSFLQNQSLLELNALLMRLKHERAWP